MLNSLRRDIEAHRGSKSFFWKSMAIIKDLFWVISRNPLGPLKIMYFRIKPYHSRKLPDFLVIGVMKGGTTSLYSHLKQHPNIEMSPNLHETHFTGGSNTKEADFFIQEDLWLRGLKWYKSLFNDNGKLQGEASPGYIFFKKAHKRMHDILPNAKLILVLRDPITRAYSHFNHGKQLLPKSKNWFNLPSGTFEENIRADIERNFNKDIISKGFYISQIEHLLKFYKRDQVLILVSEKMRKDMPGTYHKIFDFLGVKNAKINFSQKVHKRKYEKPISKQAEKMLYKIYKPYNEKLFKFLGYRIQEWSP